MWARHSAEWRDTAQITSQWREASQAEAAVLRGRASSGWWELLESLRITLFVTREYEHLVIAMTMERGRPRVSFFPLPHPSGLAMDRVRRDLYIASTRNPNQVYVLRPATGVLDRSDVAAAMPARAPFVPVASRFYPGSLYIHDLALLHGVLHANAVGHNAVVRLDRDAGFERVWWPKCIEKNGRPVFSSNHIQLNSIAAGRTLRDSFFSASAAAMGRRRPGHLNFPTDRRGVIFSSRTREPICTELTRPHSARLADGQIWVANSGYGEVGFVRDGRLETIQRLPGWTRGLCIVGEVMFVATSRVIPRFARYAPGLDVSKSRCAVYALSRKSGQILGRLDWPLGNQVFAIEWVDAQVSSGFVFEAPFRKRNREIAFSYSYITD